MSAADALRLARENGIHVGVDGADLVLEAAREPAPAVLETIARHKAEIIAALNFDTRRARTVVAYTN